MLGRVAARCGNNILLGCKATTEYLQESLAVLSINTPFNLNPTSVYEISSTTKNASNDGPVILSHPIGANSDNSPIKNDVLKNENKHYLQQTLNTSRLNDKSSCIGPRTDNKQLVWVRNDNKTINNNISNCQSQNQYIDKELLSKPKVKIRERNRTKTTTGTNISKSTIQRTQDKSQHSKHGYKQSSLNYYWPLDPDHPLQREDFIQQIKIWREIQHQFSPTSRVITTTSTSQTQTTQRTDKKWKKTHLDRIELPFNFRNQSYLEYQTRIENKEIYPMSQQLNKRVPKPTALPGITQGMCRGGGIHPPTVNAWQTAGSKRLEKKLGDVFELTSEKYLPKRLPIDTIPIATTEPKTDILLKVVIQIKRPRGSTAMINNSRTVAALLAGLQNVYLDTYLVPVNTTITDRNIINPLGVPPSDTALDSYITYEPNLPIGTMMGRLFFCSNNRLSEYKKDVQFGKYLAREHIVIEEMRLNSINPPTIGYFEDIIPDPDILRLHSKDLQISTTYSSKVSVIC
jgi:hypothetical protein